jgi:TIR domain
MADVFISYASEDRERARKLASALEAMGWSVWWDRKIIAGQTFDQVIEHELETAKRVVVLWSKYSTSSEWVKNEAAVAAGRGVLVPALIDNVKLPLEFRRKQTANLTDWDGDPLHEGFRALCEGIASRANLSGMSQPTTLPKLRFSGNRLWKLGAIAAVTVALAFGAYRFLIVSPPQDDSSGRPSSLKVETVSSPANGIDNPQSLELGVVYKVTLDKNEEYYFRLSLPASDLKIFLDMRRVDKTNSNLQSTLSVLDQDGGVVQDRAVSFNEVDVGYRKTALLSSKQPVIFGLKLLNHQDTADFWLTVLKEHTSEFVPFFGQEVPKPLALGPGEGTSGQLDKDEYVYYVTPLRKGEYKLVLDFSNAKRENTNIQGYLALLDSDGGNQREIIRFNEVNVSYRKIATFSVKKDEPLIMKVYNASRGVKYSLKIAPNQQISTEICKEKTRGEPGRLPLVELEVLPFGRHQCSCDGQGPVNRSRRHAYPTCLPPNEKSSKTPRPMPLAAHVTIATLPLNCPVEGAWIQHAGRQRVAANGRRRRAV